MSGMTDIHCIVCNGTNVIVDAYAQWDVDSQEYELVQEFDNGAGAYCADCDQHDVTWEHRPVNPMEEN